MTNFSAPTGSNRLVLPAITALVLVAFAANSLLCRWAMREYQFDPESFTMVRLVTGALTLSLLSWLLGGSSGSAAVGTFMLLRQRRSWQMGASLFIYAAAFSAAYIHLDTGLGAFILFTTVQVTLQLVAWFRGMTFSGKQLVGIAVAMVGLALLLLPGVNSGAGSSWSAITLMIVSGIGWSGFVVLGQGSAAPLADVRIAFVAAAILSILLWPYAGFDMGGWNGWLLAATSGALASGVGYFGWYQVLPKLGIQLAGQLQLLVPPIAVLMGIGFLGEGLTTVMLLGMLTIVVGVATIIRSK